MKRSVLVAALSLIAGAFSLSAQTVNLKADIPFGFRVGAAVMPAGEYTVSHANGILTLRTGSGPARAAMVLANPAHRPAAEKPGTLVFNRYGDAYFLSSVWSQNEPTGHVLHPGKLEKELIARARSAGPAIVALRSK